MRKITFLFFWGTVMIVSDAVALETSCSQIHTGSTNPCEGMMSTQTTGVMMNVDGSASMPGCASMSSQCWETYVGMYAPWYTCNSCQSGYTRTQTSAKMTGCGTSYYYYCKEDCTGCTNCTSDTSWSSAGTGYEKKVTRTCNCNTCSTNTSYRCAAGYYGSSSNGTSGCARCPSSGGVYGTSSAGSTSITSCYIPSNTSMTDDTGTYQFTSNCYYTN